MHTPTLVLLTVNDHETDALLDAFHPEGHETRGAVTYTLLGKVAGLRLVHTISEMGYGGVGAAQQRSREAIEHWSPVALIAVGIAFGIDETRQAIGDVLVATHVQDYELGRLNVDGTLTPRGQRAPSADTLTNRLRQADTTHRRAAADWPKVRFGVVLSGQKLVDNLDYRNSLRAQFGETIGGEMEAQGVYVSATAGKVDWAVVKGICDWGHTKNHPDKDAWQKTAARNAARVVKAALELGPLYTTAPSTRHDEPAETGALELSRKKLARLQVALAIEDDAAGKFKLEHQIAETQAQIAKLESGG